MYKIREIVKNDNKDVENVIRTCLIEYGANHEGTAWADPDLGRFSEIYNKEGHKYWVAVDENENLRMADIYWQNGANEDGREPIVEILADGDIEIVEIVKVINANIE